MDKYKAKLLAFVKEVLQPSSPGYSIEIIYWGTDKYGPRIAEISASKDCGNGLSGWSIMQCDQAGLHALVACERLLLHYELVETDPDDGYEVDVENYEDMVRRLLTEK